VTLFDLPFPLLLALRYGKSTRKDAFATFLTIVAGLGLALGVAALILALGALSGFQRVLTGQVLAHTPQVRVDLPLGADGEAVAERIRALPGVRWAAVVVRGQGWLLTANRGFQAVELVGADGYLPPSVSGDEPRPVEEGLHLSDRLAAHWELTPGMVVEVASPRPTLTPFGGPQPRLRTVTVEGVYPAAPGRPELEPVVLPLAMAQGLLRPVAPAMEIDAGGFGQAPAVARAVAAVMPEGARVRSWQELNRPLFFVLRLEKALIFVAVFLIVLVAALALVSSLSLLIANKRGELGMLGALGAAPGRLAGAFLLWGLILGGGATLAGALLGTAAAVLLDRLRAVPLPAGVYYLEHVPFVIEAGDLGAVVGLSLALALTAALYAAQRVSTLRPVEALRR
jgi:lipoprotein-releasing system permease protein